MISKCNELEISIIKLVIDGKSSYEIAEELGYSVWRIKKILQAIYKRFGVNNKVSLVREMLITHNIMQ